MGSTRRQARAGRLAGILLRTQPDERLIAFARDGGDAAFDEIVRRHRMSLIAYAGILAPPSRAEDVVQESLVKAYAALRDGAHPDVLRAWLFRIVRNTAIDEQRGVRYHEQLDENHDGVEQPPQALDRREQVAALVLAIRDLPVGQREALVQRELEGRGHEEIGQALGVSAGAVRQLIYRARHTLREAAGALIPVAVMRAASLPGADEAAGGLGMAGTAKLGLAAVVATGTIVAGSAIDGHDRSHKAEALGLPAPKGDSGTNGRETVTDGQQAAETRQVPGDRGGSASSGREHRESDDRGSWVTDVGAGGSGPSGSGDDGRSGSSGPGPAEGSDDHSGSGSGSEGPGEGSGSGSDDGMSGSGSSGSSGEGPGGDGSSGEGSGAEGPGGGSGGHDGSGADDGGRSLTVPITAADPN